ncbi:MAG: PorT family protein [Flavobacteriales bacterium]|nr:PorT family protein [Flavobacteriales bacterium]
MGASLGHKIAGPLHFSIGMHWAMLRGHDEYWIVDYKYSEADRRIHYVCVPMLAQFVFRGVHVGLGYQLGVPFSEYGTGSTYYSAFGLEDVSYNSRRLGIKKTDLGVVAEVGYHVSDHFGLSARFYHGLQNINDPIDGMTASFTRQQLCCGRLSDGTPEQGKPLKKACQCLPTRQASRLLAHFHAFTMSPVPVRCAMDTSSQLSSQAIG